MPSNPLNTLVQQIRAAVERDGGGRSDGELLTRFLSQRDHDALAALVKRHAPMVWGVCRRILGNQHDAEDAFQATFIVLVRKAATVVPREMVGNWLYGVAQQTAVRLRGTAAKRSAREMQMKDTPEPVVHDVPEDELLSLLDQELSRLPQRSRALIVLCDLEGKSRKDVARQLGCPEGTVASGLARARQLLAKRMARHGPAVTGVSLAAMLAHSAASAGVPPEVLTSTINVATSVAAGTAVGVISGPVAALTEQVVKTMFLKKLTTTTTILAALTAAAITFGSLAIGQTEGVGKPRDPRPVAEKPVDAPAKQQEKEKEPFTAWGTEVGGLQAGLGFPLGGKRVYRVGESVNLAVRIRNVSKETIDFRYIRAFFFENPPTITDADGNRIQLLKLTGDGRQFPRSTKLSPGQAADIFDWSVSLLPKGDSGAKGSYAIHGTGKFNLQCERVVGPTLSNPNHPDPARDKLASGTLELEVEPAAANAEREPFTAWGKEVGGLQAGLGFRPGEKQAYRHGETVKLVVRVRNVGKEAVKFEYLREYFVETPPTVTDAKGKSIPQPERIVMARLHQPVKVSLEPGKEIDLTGSSPVYERTLVISPAFGTGKVEVQYERVLANSHGGNVTVDPALRDLATGKLELEVQPAAQASEDITHDRTRIQFTGSVTSSQSPVNNCRIKTFRGQVRAFCFPDSDRNVADLTTPVKGSLFLTCEKLDVMSQTINVTLGDKVVKQTYQEIFADGGDRFVDFQKNPCKPWGSGSLKVTTQTDPTTPTRSLQHEHDHDNRFHDRVHSRHRSRQIQERRLRPRSGHRRVPVHDLRHHAGRIAKAARQASACRRHHRGLSPGRLGSRPVQRSRRPLSCCQHCQRGLEIQAPQTQDRPG